MPAAGAWLAAGFAGAGGVGAGLAASAIISVGSSLVIGALSKKRGIANPGTELQISGDPLDVRAVCYGEAWTAGTLRYRNAASTDNRDFYMVIVLAGHEIDSVSAVEADRNLLTLDGSGNVTAPSQYVGLMNVRYVYGTDSQSVDSTLDSTFSNWTTDHRLRGLAYAIVKLTFDETNMNTVPAFRFKVKGRKVYDPRLDSTNGGAGAHRLATPSTWAWSRNPILCANDFLRGVSINSIYVAGLGLASTRFDWANVAAEANVCEENVALAAGGNEDRYTCDGFIDPRQTPEEIVRHFEMAIAGEIIPSDGKWRFFCGAYRTPTLALTDEHFVGPLRHVVHKGELDRVDTATGRYAALAESGTVVNYSPVRLSTATTGSERAVEFDLQLVADTTDTPGTYDGGARAQRIAKLLLEKEEAGKQIICQTSLYGLRAVPGETITITHAAFGLSSQAMRVMEVQLRPVPTDTGVGLAVDLVLEAGPSSLYTWSAAETAIGAAPTLPQQQVPALNGVAPWTPILVNVSRNNGNTFTKTAGADSTWNASVYSQESYARAVAGFTVTSLAHNVAVGLNASPASAHDQDTIDFCWRIDQSNDHAYVFQNGSNVFDSGVCAVGDRFEIVRNGTGVFYYKNGAVQFEAANGSGAVFLDSSFYTLGASVEALVFGSLEQVATGQIDPNAATIDYYTSDTTATHSSSAVETNTTEVLTVAVTAPDTSSTIEVTITFELAVSGTAWIVDCRAGRSSSPTAFSEVVYRDSADDDGSKKTHALTFMFAAVSGSQNVSLRSIIYNSVGDPVTATYTNINIVATVVKR